MRDATGQLSTGHILTISAGVIFFAVVVFIVGLRIYALHYRRQEAAELVEHGSIEGSHRRSTYLRRLCFALFGEELHQRAGRNSPSGQDAKMGVGLEASVFEKLPTFAFKRWREKLELKEDIECSVCLEEFIEGERGRILPKCGHCFHADCIDMWFFSHTTCPICRSEVESPPESLPITVSAADPPEGTTNENGSHPSGSSGEMDAAQSFSSDTVPSSDAFDDLELGFARRQSQRDGRSAVRPSITGPSNSSEGIEDGSSDIHQVYACGSIGASVELGQRAGC